MLKRQRKIERFNDLHGGNLMAAKEVIAEAKWLTGVVRDAKAAGYTVASKNGTTRIFVADKRSVNKALKGIVIYPDGMGIDITVDLSVAKSIRGEDKIRKFLGLAPVAFVKQVSAKYQVVVGETLPTLEDFIEKNEAAVSNKTLSKKQRLELFSIIIREFVFGRWKQNACSLQSMLARTPSPEKSILSLLTVKDNLRTIEQLLEGKVKLSYAGSDYFPSGSGEFGRLGSRRGKYVKPSLDVRPTNSP